MNATSSIGAGGDGRRSPDDDVPNLQAGPQIRHSSWRYIAPIALMALAAVVACNKVWTYDVFWHLKSGQWMLEHRQVLGRDIFSTPETPGAAPARWVNVHWLFQVIVASVHGSTVSSPSNGLGRFGGLVVLKMIAFAGTMGVFAFWMRKRIGPAWLMFTGLWIILAVEPRIRVRPEIITFVLLAATIAILESVRLGGSPNRLWWLVPINIIWVNVHGLFIVGVVTAWAAIAGLAVDRALRRTESGRLFKGKTLLPVLVASAACFVNPWPVEAILHPLLLRTRVSGEQSLYTFGVEEFRPTYTINPFGNIPVLVGLLLGAAVLVVLLARRRRVPTGHVLWFLMFGALAALAVRNVTLFAIPAGFILAIHGGQWIDEIVKRRRWLSRAGPPAAVAMLLLLAATAFAYATETVSHWQKRRPNRFGLGLVDGLHPVDMARWLGRSSLSGDVLTLDFGNGGAFICYSCPRRKVWMDGRLEVHSLEKFRRLNVIRRNMLSSSMAGDPSETPLPPSVRFIVVRHADTRHIKALNNSRRFKLLYMDRAAVCFARIPLPGEPRTGQLREWHEREELPFANLDRFDRPVGKSPRQLRRGILEVQTVPHWYRRNVQPAHWRMGAVFYSLGLDNLAVRYLSVADVLEIQEPISRAGLLAEAHRRLSELHPVEPDANLPIDPNLSRALALFRKVDLTDLRARRTREYAMVHVNVLKFSRHIDSAYRAVSRYLDNLPIPGRWWPSNEELRTRDSIKLAYDLSVVRRDRFDLSALAPMERALLLTRKDIGLIDLAVAELQSARALSPQARMLLGDLLLRKGMAKEARRTYERIAGKVKPALRMRLGLCDWVRGDFASAETAMLAAAADAPHRPEPVVYLALLNEQLGDYRAAAEMLNRYIRPPDEPEDSQAIRLLKQIRARLKVRGVLVR